MAPHPAQARRPAGPSFIVQETPVLLTKQELPQPPKRLPLSSSLSDTYKCASSAYVNLVQMAQRRLVMRPLITSLLTGSSWFPGAGINSNLDRH